jgi:hypothetical protein
MQSCCLHSSNETQDIINSAISIDYMPAMCTLLLHLPPEQLLAGVTAAGYVNAGAPEPELHDVAYEAQIPQ